MPFPLHHIRAHTVSMAHQQHGSRLLIMDSDLLTEAVLHHRETPPFPPVYVLEGSQCTLVPTEECRVVLPPLEAI